MQAPAAASRPAELLILEDWDGGCAGPRLQERALEVIESGGIVILPHVNFHLSTRETALLSDVDVVLPGQKERVSRNGRPTITFDPDSRRIVRGRVQRAGQPELEAMMARFSGWARGIVDVLLPSYRATIERDRVTYRPCGRTVRQGLHVDSSYGRPHRGRCMLRVFSNIDPSGQPRIWQVGESFEPFAVRFLGPGQVNGSWRAWLAERLGLTWGRATVYDHVMGDMRERAKRDSDYQANAPRQIVEFPGHWTWLAITDLVIHGAVSGRHCMDQTFFLPTRGMRDESRSSLRILERLMGRSDLV